MSASTAPFGRMPDGRPVDCVTLCAHGLEARIITLGAALQALHVPDRNGQMEDVVLGGDDVEAYLDARRFFGAVIGRFANRIAGGRYTLDGRVVRLPVNDGPNCLHGGPSGFDTHVWQVAAMEGGSEPFVEMVLALEDGADSFPGAVRARARYTLTAPGTLTLDLQAQASEAGPINMTGHSYFNLAGAGHPDGIGGHVLRIDAEQFLPIDATSIPEGAPRSVAGSPFDFRDGARIGAQLDLTDPQIAVTGGFDHNYCYADRGAERLMAELFEPGSGRRLSVFSDRSGLQFYSGQFLDGNARGKGGRTYGRYGALCLEPQDWPDSPNRPDFPDVVVPAGATYRHTIRYAFA
ncbi:aldose epimerase family protein [Aureimonas frigidaquae]|uniref:aldose epimerase family protein n=1 Tax=Aureimonas frigidaquae TaxID=424757 RepID=UPI00078372E7|nr:aldose epimerase family protein [Aureimonas frigidaquae]